MDYDSFLQLSPVVLLGHLPLRHRGVDRVLVLLIFVVYSECWER